MAKAKKTRSGKWTIRVYAYQDKDGKHYKRITADTKAECEYLAAKYRADDPKKVDKQQMTVGQAVDLYIAHCRVLSPATVAGYQKIRRTAFQDLMDLKVADLTEDLLQEAVDDEAFRVGRRGLISPKTLANEWGLISSSLWKVSRVKYEIRLPKRYRKFKDYPEPKAVIDAVHGSEVELPVMLALWLSFSISEIRGLRWSDVKDGVVTINRVMIDVANKPVVKAAGKAEMRNRRHRLPVYIQQLLEAADHSSEYIVPQSRTYIYYHFRKLMDSADLGITFHDLRHLNASVMLMLNIPEKYAMERGGWKTSNVMKSVYQHTFTEERIAVDDMVDEYFDSITSMTLRYDSSGQTH